MTALTPGKADLKITNREIVYIIGEKKDNTV